jgi:predicted RNase H-like HicB family nuclease
MQLTVLVERINDHTYRAETAQPVSLAAEGRTREEALERLRILAQQRLTAGEMVHLELSDVTASHPWVPYAGIWRDHPDIEALLDNITEYRRQLDEAESEA